MSLPIVLHPEAEAEFSEAYDWFESRWASGEQFANAIQAVFKRIGSNPKLHAISKKGVRRAVVNGYRYYAVYYREYSDHLEVLSVFHASRDPKTWQDRV